MMEMGRDPGTVVMCVIEDFLWDYSGSSVGCLRESKDKMFALEGRIRIAVHNPDYYMENRQCKRELVSWDKH